jgi:hypothetical protein
VKKFIFFLIAVSFVLGLNVSAFALPFSSLGWVDPNYNNSWDSTNLTGTARYHFDFSNPDVNVTELDLQFEGDIFNLSLLDASDFNVIVPPTWTTTMWIENGVSHWGISSGEGVDFTQSPIIVDVNYTLLSSSRYSYGNSAFAGDLNQWEWDEAQGANNAWSQKYDLVGDSISSGRIYTSGGSTAPVPEPATMSLLGMGILGLFGLRRKS